MNDFTWKLFNNHILIGGRRCRDRMVIGFKRFFLDYLWNKS